MKYYNLLGQFSYTKGGTNPDAPEAGPYVYTSPPGFGDNKGVATIQGVVTGPVDKQGHKEKLKDSGLDEDEDFTQFSFGEKEVPDVSDAVRPLSQREYATIKNLDDIKKLNQNRKFSTNQINRLKSAFGANDIENIFTVGSEEVSTTVAPPNTRFPRNPNLTIKDVEDYSIFGSDAVYVASAIKNIEEKSKTQPKSLTMTEAINLLRKYDTIESVTSEEKVNLETTASEGLNNLNNLLSDGTITNTEFNAFSNALTEIVEKPEGSKKKEVITGGGSATLYIVVGSPGNYTLKAVNPGDDGYESGMSQEAAQATADELNAGFEPTGGNDLEEPGSGLANTFVPDSLDPIELNNIPVGAEVWDVEGTLYLAYAVPGAGDLYTGSTIWMAYDVVGNDLFEAGLLTEGFEYKGPNGSPSKSWFDTTAILSGNSNQLIGMDSDPFASFVETYKEEALLRPWLLDNEFIELQAEAALEDRDISEAEWRATTWYQTNNQAKRDWMDIELSDPAEAQRQRDDLEIYYKNQLQGLGVSNVPDGLIQWVSSQNITGSWSDLKTAEQLQLFADPYKTGERDGEMLNLISTSGFGDVDRTSAREKEVVELYRKWLGPSLGSLTQDEVSSIAGRLRDDPDYEDALVNSLKQSRLAAFGNYSNPELTYEDIARPWRNLTTSVWGQTADETQGWWQEMLKSNDYSTAQTTLREKGLEQNINQVSVDASQALQNALGQGSVSQSGVNV